MQAANVRGGGGTKKGWLRGVILILAWVLIMSLWKDVLEVKTGFSRIDDAKARLEIEEAKNADLKKKLETVQTREYKEKLIREKLNMQKQGEVVVVLPGSAGYQTQASEAATSTSEAAGRNWEKWWTLVK